MGFSWKILFQIAHFFRYPPKKGEKIQKTTTTATTIWWWFHFFFQLLSLPGEMIQFDDHIFFYSNGLVQPPTRQELPMKSDRGEVPNLEAGSDPVHQDGCWELFPTSSLPVTLLMIWGLCFHFQTAVPRYFWGIKCLKHILCWKLMGFSPRKSVCHGSFAEMCGQSDNFCLTASFQLLILLFRSDVFSKEIWISIVKSFLLDNPTKPSKTEQPPT